MNVGLFNKKIEIHSKTTTKDEYGSVNDIYTKKYELKSYVKNLNANKKINANEIFYEQTLEFIVYKKNINLTDIVIYNNSKYRIIDIVESVDGIFLTIIGERINE